VLRCFDAECAEGRIGRVDKIDRGFAEARHAREVTDCFRGNDEEAEALYRWQLGSVQDFYMSEGYASNFIAAFVADGKCAVEQIVLVKPWGKMEVSGGIPYRHYATDAAIAKE
jgi:hypothetical protein